MSFTVISVSYTHLDVYKRQFRELPEALSLYRRAEAVYRELLPASDYRFASLYNNMAQAMLKSNDVKGAADHFAKSLSLLEKMTDVESEIATCNTNMAFCLLAEKRLDEARVRLERAEAIFRALPGDDPHYDSTLSCRGQLEYLLGRYAESAEAYRELASNIERRFGRSPNSVSYTHLEPQRPQTCGALSHRRGAQPFCHLSLRFGAGRMP